MAVFVYRKGDSEEINGIKCDKALIPAESLKAHLEAGWVADVDDLKPKKAAPKKKATPKGE